MYGTGEPKRAIVSMGEYFGGRTMTERTGGGGYGGMRRHICKDIFFVYFEILFVFTGVLDLGGGRRLTEAPDVAAGVKCS